MGEVHETAPNGSLSQTLHPSLLPETTATKSWSAKASSVCAFWVWIGFKSTTLVRTGDALLRVSPVNARVPGPREPGLAGMSSPPCFRT
jgi:hypothetical protein